MLTSVLGAVCRRQDDDGVELSHEEQKDDRLDRLQYAADDSRWVLAAHEVHEASTLLADLRRTAFPEAVWRRFAEGREAKVHWYRRIAERLTSVGFDAPIMVELRAVADALVEREQPGGGSSLQ